MTPQVAFEAWAIHDNSVDGIPFHAPSGDFDVCAAHDNTLSGNEIAGNPIPTPHGSAWSKQHSQQASSSNGPTVFARAFTQPFIDKQQDETSSADTSTAQDEWDNFPSEKEV